MDHAALVTGASRGVGRGVAASLAASGFQVFATGRTIGRAELPEGIIRIACDHRKTEETDAVFREIGERAGRLDVLVNSAWGGYERMVEGGKFTWPLPFWEQPQHRWDSMMNAGVRAAFECSARAAKMMVGARQGLIVNISFWAAQKYVGNAVYGMAKAATDKMTADTARELRDHGVTVVSMYPGLVRTEAVLAAAREGWLDLSNSESPEFVGLVIAALARDPERMRRTGQVLVAAGLAAEYGVEDIDGKRPRALTREEV
ncbi:MAG TPA: SDR family NAD(P)-dependent oxidoreductase [Bryobacteraceae bacterium]|nr:SDR family NAD(P)-dependent oxidoreductase [Bryobacteraceae bacterium]